MKSLPPRHWCTLAAIFTALAFLNPSAGINGGTILVLLMVPILIATMPTLGTKQEQRS